jgi:hypothetical protein
MLLAGDADIGGLEALNSNGSDLTGVRADGGGD